MSARGAKKRRNEVHVVWVGHWVVESKGEDLGFRYKAPALEYGRKRAKALKAELFAHTQDGRIGYRNSYGGDPRRRKG